jgi:hypothetical protein
MLQYFKTVYVGGKITRILVNITFTNISTNISTNIVFKKKLM